MIFRAARDRPPNLRFFTAKVVLLVLGASLGITGMATNVHAFVIAALVFVGIGIALGVIARRQKDPE